MASPKAAGAMAMAAFLAIFLLMSTENVAATLPSTSILQESALGRKVLEAAHKPNGRSGYNSYEHDGRSGYNGYKPTGRGGYK